MANGNQQKATRRSAQKPSDKILDGKITKPEPRRNGIFSEIMEVQVGGRKEPFRVHKGILCRSSPFFRAACRGPWKESREKMVPLPEDEPHIFEIYMDWLYFNQIAISGTTGLQSSCPDRLVQLTACEAYKFGDKILDTNFKNDLTLFFFDLFAIHQTYYPSTCTYVYEELPDSAQLRRVIPDALATGATTEDFEKMREEEMPQELLIDILKVQSEIRDERRLEERRESFLSNLYRSFKKVEGTVSNFESSRT